MLERAQAAETLLKNPLINEVLASLFTDAQNELMACAPGDLTAMRAHARMLGLKGIRDGLHSIINDAKIHKVTA